MKTKPIAQVNPGIAVSFSTAAPWPPAIEALRHQACNALCELRELAKTDLAALEVLATELAFQIRGLNADCLENLDHARKLTRRCPQWPSVVAADADIEAGTRALKWELQLGEESLSYNGRKQWSRAEY
jgi:hypothetical protein